MSALQPSEGVILVGVDGSPESKDALRWAARQAELTGAPLRAAMAWHVPLAGYGMSIPGSMLGEATRDARALLDSVVDEVVGPAPEIAVEKVILEGQPSPSLVKESKSAGLLVVGSRGHGAFAGMLLGSVSQHCVSHAHCPVVVVRQPQQV